MAEITVVAWSKAKAGKEAEWEKALRAVVRPTHLEPGCIKYTLHRGVEDPGRLVVLERWASQEDLDNHLAAPHIRDLFKKAESLVESSEITTYAALAEGDPSKGRF